LGFLPKSKFDTIMVMATNLPLPGLTCAILAVGTGLASARDPLPETPQAASRHWAFIAPAPVQPPQVKHAGWVRNPIDNFILARLEKEQIRVSPEADRVTLLRRLSLDLIGLPPTVAEVAAFVEDRSHDAYERQVERLLASPQFGERWGRHWLDVARYADSNGYSIDAPRSVWKYRDWVIGALNRDLPFDQFVIDQLAGDLLPAATLDQKIATGFHRNTQINQEGGIDPEQFRVESVIDRVNTTGTAFLGLTIGCAQCHDHKFDPITQADYYRLLAFFNNAMDDGHGKGAPEGMLEVPGEFEDAGDLQKQLEEAEADLDRYVSTYAHAIVNWEKSLTSDQREKLASDARQGLALPWEQRKIAQKRAAYAAFRPEDSEFNSRHSRFVKLEKREPKPVTTLVMAERTEPRESFVFLKGDFTRKGQSVTPGVPAVLHSLVPLLPGTSPTPSRLDLAGWIVDRKNPLTARVAVNRIWQEYFGRGLVETENDFGTQGSPPTHPELLDWLANEFMAPTVAVEGGRSSIETAGGSTPRPHHASQKSQPWSLKHLHRLIVTSATYRQSSRARLDLASIDPDNKLLARQTRLRLGAEVVRDVCLRVSGLLVERVGGPSVFPPQPDGVMKLGQLKREWNVSTGADRYRRGMYTFWWRATPYPALAVFDAPDAFSVCTRRLRSDTPLQALTLLNDETFVECARALAARVLRQGPKSETGRLELAFRLCLARAPVKSERNSLLDLLRSELAAEARTLRDTTGQSNTKADGGVQQLAAWTAVSRVLLNLDETITRE
jgi:hypothetical protein